MEALLIVIVIIVAIPVLLNILGTGFFLFYLLLRLLVNLAPGIWGIAIGISVSNNGNVTLGVIIILISLALGFGWFLLLEEHLWEKTWPMNKKK